MHLGTSNKKENIVQHVATRCFPEGRKLYFSAFVIGKIAGATLAPLEIFAFLYHIAWL